MEPQWRPLQEPAARRAWEEVLRPLAAQIHTGAVELAAQMVDVYQAELPRLFPDASAVAQHRASTEASIRQIAQAVEAGDDPRSVDLPPATAALGRSGAQRGLPLTDLIRLGRLGQQHVWQWLFERITVTTPAAGQAKALELASNWLFAYVDDLLARAERVYEIERETWLSGAVAARAAGIDDILAGREADPQRASKRLRYNVNRHHIVLCAWMDTTHDDAPAQATLSAAMTQLASAVSAQNTLIHPAGSTAIAGWLSRPDAFTSDELAAVRSGGAGLPQGVGIAVGEPGWGIEGFRRGHVEASHAQRVAVLLGGRASVVTSYRDVAVAALAGTDSAHAVAFVNRVLGPLAADDDGTYRIATTLAVYLEENRSLAKAAQRLSVHPNTVSYRVDQAEHLLGHPVDRNSVDLSVALALLPVLPGLTPRRRTGLC